MAYRVEIAKNAEVELEQLYLWVVERAPPQGAKWFNGLERAVLSLSSHPRRCPIAPENVDPESPVRVLHHGRKPHICRVFFLIAMIPPRRCWWCTPGAAHGSRRRART